MRLILRDGEQVDFAKHAVVVRNEFHAIQWRPIIEPPGKLIVADDLYADRLILCPQVTSVDRWSTEIVSSRGSVSSSSSMSIISPAFAPEWERTSALTGSMNSPPIKAILVLYE